MALGAALLLAVGCGGEGDPGVPGPQGDPGAQGPAGATGPAGVPVVTLNSVEPAGTHCTFGGTKVEFGPDIDGDVQLDPGEVNPALTRYVCNGEPGFACWDLNTNHACDVASEDKDGDGACTVADCHTPNVTEYIRNGTSAQSGASFNVAGNGVLGGTLTTGDRLRIQTSKDALTNSAVLFQVRAPLQSTYPPTDMVRMDNAGGLVAMGEIGYGIIPASGNGWRMMWHPFKAAFRAGGVGSDSGRWDDANVGFYSWAGGYNTQASAYANFAHGDSVLATGSYAAGFGSNSTVSGNSGFSAGASNTCTGFGCATIGFNNVAGGQGAVALGYRVSADADHTVALGQRVSTNGFTGAFVWGDASTTTVPANLVSSNNQFAIRSSGGVRFFTNSTLTTGVTLNAGGSSWNVVSDRNAKTAFQPVDGEQVLEKLSRMPLQTWAYKAEASQPRHVGPMAQDFHAAFGLGLDDRTINTLDIDGINMVAIQALERRTDALRESTRQVQTLQQQVELLQRQLDRLERELERRKQ